MKPVYLVWTLFLVMRSLFFTGVLGAQSKPDALVAYRAARYGEAVDICRAEIQADSRNVESYVVLCWSLVKLKRYEEARSAAKTALAMSPYDPRLLEIMGEASYFQGRNSEALKYFQEYIYIAPEGQRIDTAYYYCGEIYIRLGRFKHADIALSTALHYVPENALWQTRLAYARESSGELRQAAEAYEKALALDPQLADARRGLDRVRAALIQRQ
jgi:tetratricopeptide (TPR) repeat protein